MTATAAGPVASRRRALLSETWRALRTAHPVRLLRLLRAGLLATVCATAVVYLVTATQGGQEVTTVRRSEEAGRRLADARRAVHTADEALRNALRTGQIELIGPGAGFANTTARIGTLLTAAGQGNAAGATGRAQFQFVQGKLLICQQLINTAVSDYPRGGPAGVESARDTLTAPRLRDPDTGRQIPGTGGLRASIEDLQDLQSAGLARQRDTGWLDPVRLWGFALAPPVVMLALFCATARILAIHFRRRVNGFLVATLAVTLAVTGVFAGLTLWDEDRLALHPAAGHPATMALVLLALVAAGVLNHLAHRPRLAEYRYPRP
ncbi:hypothetical protein ABII15_03290 [Streptomyces sp. HUAS MG91]|uniref:Integral membrane protein n=1 Tax=Streptomyces tabacisoli TaxID=3156398 RepID=A0AAU8ILW0_9ACTN